VKPLQSKRSKDENVLETELSFMIRKSWIGVEPKVDDLITIAGKTSRISNVAQNALLDEWYLTLAN
jgi:hypothetical protein